MVWNQSPVPSSKALLGSPSACHRGPQPCMVLRGRDGQGCEGRSSQQQEAGLHLGARRWVTHVGQGGQEDGASDPFLDRLSPGLGPNPSTPHHVAWRNPGGEQVGAGSSSSPLSTPSAGPGPQGEDAAHGGAVLLTTRNRLNLGSRIYSLGRGGKELQVQPPVRTREMGGQGSS